MSYDNWVYKSKYPEDIISTILKNRKIKDLEKFIDPKYDDLINSDVFRDIKKAVRIINRAVKDKKKIGIFMDYDADGVTGGAILFKTFQLLGVEPKYYVPERTEGYGLNKKALNFFIENKIDLLITVDCGVKNHKEIELANQNGIEVIIVDHHQLDEILPKAVAIIHPKITKTGIDLELSGGATAFMLSRAMISDQNQVKWLIDLAAISLVADVVPIVDDSRVIVKFGLVVLNKTKNLGLKELYKIAGLKEKIISTYDIGFVIAPRLNAAGRIAHPKDAFKLLISKDPREAKQLAEKLNHLNLIRQEKLQVSIREAESAVIQTGQDSDNMIILLGDWDEGIIGLIASKICEKYYRPTIVLTKVDGFLKGSARSIKSVNVTNLISSAKELLLSYGGHVQAAGLSLVEKQYPAFLKILKNKSKKIDKKLFVKKLQVDALLRSDQLSLVLAEKIEKLQPFGVGNPRPVFAIKDVTVKELKVIGKDSNHLKITACSDDSSHQCLMFNYLNHDWLVNAGDIIDIAFSLNINEWNDRKNLDLMIEDVKKK